MYKIRKRTFIIAEAGVNHNGNPELAMKMIDVASKAGADAIKFQTFKAEKVISRGTPKAEYQKESTNSKESQLEMVKKLELDESIHKHLYDHCQKKNIFFLSTPFDLESIDLLNRLGLKIFKIPSGEINNLPYLQKIGALNRRLIMSTGMADLGEIEDALEILTTAGTALKNITVLHCNTDYPTPFEDVNLNAISTIRNAFPQISVGFSDHTLGIEVSVAAVALGAMVVEKHFTLDKNSSGPDHKASVEPTELAAMVKAIRNIEKALGSGVKKPSPSERKNMPIVRKSIIAACVIKKGEIFSEKNLMVKRPGTGISPMRWNEIVGLRASKNYKEDDLIET